MTEPDAEISSRSSIPNRGRTVGIVSLLTLAVAFLGYLREATLASRFGLSTTMDAYFAATFIPMLAYMVLIAGTLSPVFIPILVQQDEVDHARLSETFSVVTNCVLILMAITITVGVMTVHYWLPVLFAGFSDPTIAVAIRLVYIIFPAVIFIAAAGILTALLNGFHKFSLATIAPALSSVTVIGAALLAHNTRAIYMVGIATAFGFMLQFALLLGGTAALGVRYQFIVDFRHPAVAKVVRVGIPLLLYLIVANASSLFERHLASGLYPGAISTLTYAARLFAIPANFFAAPIAMVAYPLFAREATRQSRGDLCAQVSRVLRLVCVLFLPVTIWVLLNALPLTRVFYERGQFRLADSVITSRVLMLYGIGILPNAITVTLLRCFYAIHDTITPLVAESIDLGFYIITATFLTKHFGISGLAVTRGMTFFVVGVILIAILQKRHGLVTIDRSFTIFVSRTLAASLAMALISLRILHLLQPAFDGGGTQLRMGIMAIVLVTSATTFLLVARVLKIDEATHVWDTAVDLAGKRNGS